MESEVLLERDIHSLLRERRSLKTAIRRISGQIDSDAPVTLLSTKAAGEPAGEAKRKLKDDMEPEFESEKRPKLETAAQNVDGHKRILRAGLLGHLQRARDALAKEREKESTIKHLEKEKLIDSKLEQQEKAKIETLSAELRDQLATKQERLGVVESALLEKNNVFMKAQLTRHYGYMANFIATKTQPTIFWVPRNFNPELEALRDATKQFIDQKVAAIAATEYFSTDTNME